MNIYEASFYYWLFILGAAVILGIVWTHGNYYWKAKRLQTARLLDSLGLKDIES